MVIIGKATKLQIQNDDGQWVAVGAIEPAPVTWDLSRGFEIVVEFEPDKNFVAAARAANAGAVSNADWWGEFMKALSEQGEDDEAL